MTPPCCAQAAELVDPEKMIPLPSVIDPPTSARTFAKDDVAPATVTFVRVTLELLASIPHESAGPDMFSTVIPVNSTEPELTVTTPCTPPGVPEIMYDDCDDGSPRIMSVPLLGALMLRRPVYVPGLAIWIVAVFPFRFNVAMTVRACVNV